MCATLDIALGYGCELCGARCGAPCLDPSGRIVAPHMVRRRAAARPVTPIGPVAAKRRRIWPPGTTCAERSKTLRDERRDRGDCINHDGVKADCGVRCYACRETHRRSA